MKLQHTTNVFNDLECWKHQDILHNIQTAQCCTKSDIEYNKNEGYTTICELVILIDGELDARIYKYDNINSLLISAYFIWLIDKKVDYIKHFQIWINNEISYIFDYWQKEYKHSLVQENEELTEKLQKIESALKKYGTNIDKLIKE